MELGERLLSGDGGDATSRGASLHQYADVQPADDAGLRALAPDAALADMAESVFGAQWQHAQNYLRDSAFTDEQVAATLQRGAGAFGFWTLDERTLAPLVATVRDDRRRIAAAEAALRKLPWQPELGSSAAGAAITAKALGAKGARKPIHTGWYVAALAFVFLAWAKLVTWILIERYVEFWRTILEVFAWPMILARVTALAALAATSVLFMMMSRGVLTRLRDGADNRRRWAFCWCCCFVPCCFPGRWCRPWCRSLIRWITNSHKELHILSAASLIVIGVVHTVAHLVNDLPVIVDQSAKNLTFLNSALKCDTCASRPICRTLLPRGLENPACPFTGPVTYAELLYSTPAITGYLLWLCLAAFWYYSRASVRKARYNTFYFSHNVLMYVWFALLWLHAGNQWVGVSFPLAAFVCGAPLLCYLYDRAVRFLRCHLYRVAPVSVVFRDAGGGTPDSAGGGGAAAADGEAAVAIKYGAAGDGTSAVTVARGELMRLSLTASRGFLRTFRPGMYAFLNCADIAGYEWHPLTVCSAKTDPSSGPGGDRGGRSTSTGRSGEDSGGTIDFIIAANGDWTTELLRRCKAAHVEASREARARLGASAASKALVAGDEPAYSARDAARLSRSTSASITELVFTDGDHGHGQHHRGVVAPGDALPAISVDGPFAAPTQAALEHSVIVAVGAGVGVTPFLALLETIVAQAEADADAERDAGAGAGAGMGAAAGGAPVGSATESSAPSGAARSDDYRRLRIAHMYWMTRRADDFLLAWPVISKVLCDERLRCRVVLHLHVTGKAPPRDAAAFLFRDAIARHNAALRATQGEGGGNGGGSDAGVGDTGALLSALPVPPTAGKDALLLTSASAFGVAVHFGRPDLAADIAQVACDWPEDDVHVYTCGGPGLVDSLGAACDAARAQAQAQGSAQRVELHWERFE